MPLSLGMAIKSIELSSSLTNAPAIFLEMMISKLYRFLDNFVVGSIDDILIYLNTLEEHERHLRLGIETLRKS
jgi:hypothetical protein